MVEDFAIGELDAAGFDVDAVGKDDWVRHVGAVVVAGPFGGLVPCEPAIGFVEEQVVVEAFFVGGAADGEEEEEAGLGVGSVGYLDEALFVLEVGEGTGIFDGVERLFPDDGAGAVVEADDVGVVPEDFAGDATLGGAVGFGRSGFDEPDAVAGDGDGAVDDEAAAVGPEAVGVLFVVGEDVVTADDGGGGRIAGFVEPHGFAPEVLELGADGDAGADEKVVGAGDEAPVVGAALSGCQGEGVGTDSSFSIERPGAVADGDEEAVVVGAPVAAVVGDVEAAQVGSFDGPEGLAVVGVEGDHAVQALVEEAAVDREGRRHAGVAVDAEIGAGSADPLQAVVGGGVGAAEFVVGVGGVGRVGVLVGPVAAAVEFRAAGRGGVDGELGEAAGTEETFDLGAWGGDGLAGESLLGDDEVGEAGGEREGFEIGDGGDRDTWAVEVFGVERLADPGDAGGVGVDADDGEAGDACELAEEVAVGEADDEAEAALEVGFVDSLGGVVGDGLVGAGGDDVGEIDGDFVEGGVEGVDFAGDEAVGGAGGDAVVVDGAGEEIGDGGAVGGGVAVGLDCLAELAGGAEDDDAAAGGGGLPGNFSGVGAEKADGGADGERVGAWAELGDLGGGEGGVVDLDAADAAVHGVELVGVFVGAEDEWGGNVRAGDGAGDGDVGDEDAVDVEAG